MPLVNDPVTGIKACLLAGYVLYRKCKHIQAHSFFTRAAYYLECSEGIACHKHPVYQELDRLANLNFNVFGIDEPTRYALRDDEPACSEHPIVFNVSYPRSGNTIIRNLLMQAANFVGMNAMRPGPFFFSKRINDPDFFRPRVVKDHRFQSIYLWDRVIYALRDGRDCMLSLAHMLAQKKRHTLLKRGELAEFISYVSNTYQYGNWARHVRQALQMKERGTETLIMKYDRIVNTPRETLSELIAFAAPGLRIDDRRKEQAISTVQQFPESSSIPGWGYTMRYLPDSYLHEWSMNRTRSNWRSAYDPSARKAFHETGATELLIELGFETDPDWWKTRE
jgi:hypothetical protein